MIDERKQKIELILLKNYFKTSNKDVNYYTKNSTSVLFKQESIYIKINGFSKHYSTRDLGEYPTENEIKNLIFFSNLDSNDKNYLFKKINPHHSSYGKREIIEELLNFNKQIELIENSFYDHQKTQIQAFQKRKVMYESFLENWNI